mgnify:CR=1 FL=1
MLTHGGQAGPGWVCRKCVPAYRTPSRPMLLAVGAVPCLGWKHISLMAERCAAEDPAMFTAD